MKSYFEYENINKPIKFHNYSTIELHKDENNEFQRTTDGKLIISGYSVHTGIFNEVVEIPDSELQNIAETLNQKQLRRDHSHLTDDVIGRIIETRVAFDEKVGKKGVRFKGVIRDKQLEQKIIDKFISENSIAFTFGPECSECGENFFTCPHDFSEAHIVARDCEVYEQSFVSSGADSDTTVEPSANFIKKANKDFITQLKKNKEIDSMTKEDHEPAKITQTQIPPVSVTFNSTGATESEGGKKMADELQELKDQIAALEADKTDLEEKLSEKDIKIDKLEQEKATIKDEFEETKKELQERLDAEAEAAKIAKEKLCKEIAELQVKAGKLKKEKVEERIVELFEKYDEDALAEIKDLIVIPESSGEEPGKFHAQESGVQAMPEKNDDIKAVALDADAKKLSEEEIEYRDKIYKAMINSV